jgi:hypothetical protein
VPKKLLEEMDLSGVLIEADALHTKQPFFNSTRSRGLTSRCRLNTTRKRYTVRSKASSKVSAGLPFVATDHEISHGYNIIT